MVNVLVASKLLIELLKQLLRSEHAAIGRDEVGCAILRDGHLIALALQHPCLVGHQLLCVVDMNGYERLVGNPLYIHDAEMGDVFPLHRHTVERLQDVQVVRVRIVLRRGPPSDHPTEKNECTKAEQQQPRPHHDHELYRCFPIVSFDQRVTAEYEQRYRAHQQKPLILHETVVLFLEMIHPGISAGEESNQLSDKDTDKDGIMTASDCKEGLSGVKLHPMGKGKRKNAPEEGVEYR